MLFCCVFSGFCAATEGLHVTCHVYKRRPTDLMTYAERMQCMCHPHSRRLMFMIFITLYALYARSTAPGRLWLGSERQDRGFVSALFDGVREDEP